MLPATFSSTYVQEDAVLLAHGRLFRIAAANELVAELCGVGRRGIPLPDSP